MTKKLPTWAKWAYGVGAGGFALIDRILITWLLYYYVVKPIRGEEVLVSPAIFGMIMFFGRVVDAAADPLIARWSDNHHGKMGRRMPFLLFSGVAYVAVFIALFYPPVSGKSVVNSFYLIVMLGLYFILFTAYVCPYVALLPELAKTNRERVDLATIKGAFGLLAVAIAFGLGGILIELFGPYGMVWTMGLLGLVMLYFPLLIKEKDFASAEPATLGLLEAIKMTLRNQPFIIYLVGNVTFWLGFNIITLCIPLYVTILLGGTEGDTVIFLGIVMGVALLSFMPINLLAKKYGLKVIMMTSLAGFMLILPFAYFMGKPVGFLSPQAFAYILMALSGIPVAAIFIVPDAIVAEVSDLEEKLSGQRREAMYYGTQNFILKLAMGFSTLVTGFLLQWFGSTPEQPLGVQLTGPVAALFLLVGVIVFSRYPQKEISAYQLSKKIN